MPKVLSAVFALIICAIACPAQQRSVALTFDDLPASGTRDPVEVLAFNTSILDSLDRHHAPAVGFVIERGVQEIGENAGRRLLEQWVARGYELGNHTFSHADFNDVATEQFEHEVVAGEASLKAVLSTTGKVPRHFRF